MLQYSDESEQLLARDKVLALQVVASQQQTLPKSWAEHRARYAELQDEDPDVLAAHSASRCEFAALVT